MVKYYGRARQRTGSVNTNQPGLKQAGCPSTVGKQGKIVRFLGRRVNCNLKTCGGPMSGLRCMYNVRDAIGEDKTWRDIQYSNNPAIKNYCNQVINQLKLTCHFSYFFNYFPLRFYRTSHFFTIFLLLFTIFP